MTGDLRVSHLQVREKNTRKSQRVNHRYFSYKLKNETSIKESPAVCNSRSDFERAAPEEVVAGWEMSKSFHDNERLVDRRREFPFMGT